jgi:glycosyltransferase involved in cell wall biosynthesis
MDRFCEEEFVQDGFGAKLQGNISTKVAQRPAPRVSIGVPVYNGQRFIRATLDSILAQTYTDFEVVICDNASTDSTEQICREYVARDPRVRYVRNDRNIGPAPNYNKCFEHARGELFKWCAADDIMGPDFLRRCVEELDQDPSLVAVWPSTKEIDVEGREMYVHDTEVDLAVSSPARRLLNYATINHRRHHATELWSVYRADVLRGWQPLKGSFPSADRLVVAHVILRGPMRRIPDFLFFNRSHGERSQTYLDRMKVRPGSRLVNTSVAARCPATSGGTRRRRARSSFPNGAGSPSTCEP